MMKKEFQLHEVIFKENDFQKWMYSICEGCVEIYSGYGTKEERKLATLTSGQFFGEIGMIALLPRTATAVAAEEHVVLEQITNEDFEEYLKNHPENLQPIMSSVSRRIRELTEDLSAITRMTNEALQKRENAPAGWLAVSIRKLRDKARAKNVFRDEFAVTRKRRQALTGEISSVVQFNAGDVLFRTGEQADCMYVLYDGSVGIYSDYQTENEKLLRKLQVEDVFGEMGVLDNMPRSATAVCLTNCTVQMVKPENFMAFFQNKPTKVLQILIQMCMQLRNLTETYLQVCRALEQIPPLEENDYQKDEVMAELEYIRQNHLCTSMYNITGSADWIYNYL